jgi:hypothetical protein
MKQLSLLSNADDRTSERVTVDQCLPISDAESPQRIVKHWVGENPTARGVYCHYYWQERKGGRAITKNRYIRGSAKGTEWGEARRSLVEGWIDSGLTPREICQKLEQLPRSKRRSRHPDFEQLRDEG